MRQIASARTSVFSLCLSVSDLSEEVLLPTIRKGGHACISRDIFESYLNIFKSYKLTFGHGNVQILQFF